MLTATLSLLLLPPLCTSVPYAAGPPDLALIDPLEKNASFWWNEGQEFLEKRIQRLGEDRDGTAKNVIMFIGDGMGASTMTAARWYKGQVTGNPRPLLSWEDWPGMSLSRVYCVDSMVADSGCSATAYSSGVKGNFFSMGVSGRVKGWDCEAQMEEAKAQDVTSILQWAMEAGKSTGIVTTTDITDASPASFYSHIASRRWKNDNKVPFEGCQDIAMQMIRSNPGKDINVLMGRGRKNFIPESEGGARKKDNLITEWITSQFMKLNNYAYIDKSSDIEKVDTQQTDFLLGLFEAEDKPDLTAMTKSAIEILSKNPKGFFLFVENEEIDNMNHDNLAGGALEEVLKLEDAVNTALNMTNNNEKNKNNLNENNTLVFLSADHAHTLTISGYPKRGQDILGRIKKDGAMILNYASGPGWEDEFQGNVTSSDRLYPSLHPSSSAWHGGDDVPVYAWGPGSKMFWGNIDQNVIPHLLGYSACLGKGRRHAECDNIGNATDIIIFLFSLNPSLDPSLISQCAGDGKYNCKAVTINNNVLDGLKEGDTVHLLPNLDIDLRLKRPPTQGRSSLSYSFAVGEFGEAMISVGKTSSVYGSIKPIEGSVNYEIENCGSDCNVIYQRDKGYFNQFDD